MVASMKKSLIAAFLGAILPSGCATAETPNWLAGCWETPDGDAREVWVAESDGSMLGFGVVLGGGAIRFYELLTIKPDQTGAMTYTAYPSGQGGTAFLRAEQAGNFILFVNPGHDYPQEIAYRRDGDTLEATISETDGKNPQSFTKQMCG